MIHGEDEKLSIGNDGERERDGMREKREAWCERVSVMERERDEKWWRENTFFLHIKH